MSVVTLAELLTHRDESIRVSPQRGRVLAIRLARWVSAAAFPASARAIGMLLHFLNLHGLVLSACAAFVIAAATLSVTLAWFVAGAALFFLEARRR